jgi:hypothetical protein
MEKPDVLKSVVSIVTIVSVITGLVISIVSFSKASRKEAESRIKDAESRKFEATKPFLELRQRLYLEALRNAAVLASKDLHTKEEVESARKRFSELYWGELSLVEEKDIKSHMQAIATAENLRDSSTLTQRLTYTMAQVMRESLVNSWRMDTIRVGTAGQ